MQYGALPYNHFHPDIIETLDSEQVAALYHFVFTQAFSWVFLTLMTHQRLSFYQTANIFALVESGFIRLNDSGILTPALPVLLRYSDCNHMTRITTINTY